MKAISVHELHSRSGVPLVDVREADEFAAGRVPGAINLPLSTLGEQVQALPADPFDVICQVGGRSARVVTALTELGYDATNVEGGFSEWLAAGYSVER